MQPAEVTTLANALISAQLAQRFHDLALCNDEIADLLRAAHRTETNGRMLTDDDGTSFAIPAGTSVAASALVEVPIAS